MILYISTLPIEYLILDYKAITLYSGDIVV